MRALLIISLRHVLPSLLENDGVNHFITFVTGRFWAGKQSGKGETLLGVEAAQG